MTDYLTARDVAERLAVPLRTAYDILARPELPRHGGLGWAWRGTAGTAGEAGGAGRGGAG